MNRLTEWTGERWIANQLKIGIGDKAIYAKLAAYEDTGLEPEEFKELVELYKHKTDGAIKTLQEWKEFKTLEEQGLLIKLPCKVGDTVYHIFTGKIIEDRVIRITLNKDINEIDLRLYGYIALNSIGKTVFLTREEAEKALEVPDAKA